MSAYDMSNVKSYSLFGFRVLCVVESAAKALRHSKHANPASVFTRLCARVHVTMAHCASFVRVGP